MGRFPQPANGHGSLRDIQILTNDFSELLIEKVRESISLRSNVIDWVSPKESDKFSEYRDEAFLKALGIETLEYPLNNFWPKKGPQWDALGVGNHKEVFLVEAKANVPEIVSPGTLSRGTSRDLIAKSLEAVTSYPAVRNERTTPKSQLSSARKCRVTSLPVSLRVR
jgi:hypothetical protein